MYNRKAFKQEAKQLMRASTPHFMLVALVYVLLTSGLNYVVSWLTGGSGMLAGTLSLFLNILVVLFSIVMSVGFVNYALRLSRKEPTGMGSLFAAFSFTGRALGVQLLVALFLFLWFLLMFVAIVIIDAAVFFLTSSVPVIVAVTVVLYIAALVLIYIIYLRYAMAPFALVDHPDAGVMGAIRRSTCIMRGYKGKYFVLALSFIGWDILVGLISAIVTAIGFHICGGAWFLQAILAQDDLWTIYAIIQELEARLILWNLLADVLSLPLLLWLAVYLQTSLARFYNHVSGYDYHQYMNGWQTPPVQGSQQTPAGGDDAPRSFTAQTPEESRPSGQAQQPRQEDYYTSILPPDDSAENPDGGEEES